MSDTREEFEKWLEKQDMLLIPQCGFESLEGDLAFLAWQAAASASDARYQARIKELEESLRKILDEPNESMSNSKCVEYMVKYAKKPLSTTTPDTALQRKVLEARIDQSEAILRFIYSKDDKHTITVMIYELRAQLASLNRNETLGE